MLAKVAEAHVAQTEAAYAAQLRGDYPGWSEEHIQEIMEERVRDSPSRSLLVFAMVCKPWRRAQLKVGGRLRTRVKSDVLLSGSVALAKWALAEGCPREGELQGQNMANRAAGYGHWELVQWLIKKQGFVADKWVMAWAATSGNLELMKWLRGEGAEWDESACAYAALTGHLHVLQWLRGKGCAWNGATCHVAVNHGQVEVLRWARENGCEWSAYDRDRAYEKLGYTDDFGNLDLHPEDG